MGYAPRMDDTLGRLADLRSQARDLQARADATFAELHRSVADAVDAGESPSKIARAIGVNRVSVYRMAERGRAIR